MSELEIGGRTYRTGRLDVFEQAKIVRRCSGLLYGLVRAAALMPPPLAAPDDTDNGAIAPPSEEIPTEDNARVGEAMQAISDALKSLDDADMDYVLKTCLNKASIKNDAGGWARLMVNGTVMFEEQLDLGVASQIVMTTVQENVGPTLRGLLGNGLGAAPPTA